MDVSTLGTKWVTEIEYIDAFHWSAGSTLEDLAKSVGGWMREDGSGVIIFEDYSQRDPAVISVPKLRLSDVPEEGFIYGLSSYSEPAASLAGTVKVGSLGNVHVLPGPGGLDTKVVWSLEPASIALAADEEQTYLADYVGEDASVGGLIARRAGTGGIPVAGWGTVDGVATPFVKNYGRSGDVVLKGPGGGLTIFRLLVGARVQNRQTTERAFLEVGSGEPILELDMPAQGLRTTAMSDMADWALQKYSNSPATMEVTLTGASLARLLEIFGRDVGLPVWVRHVLGPGNLAVDALFYTEGIKFDWTAGQHPRVALSLEEAT